MGGFAFIHAVIFEMGLFSGLNGGPPKRYVHILVPGTSHLLCVTILFRVAMCPAKGLHFPAALDGRGSPVANKIKA